MNPIDLALLAFLFGFSPVAFYIFGRAKFTLEGGVMMFSRYRIHLAILLGILVMKSALDMLNDPIKEALNLDFTPLIFSIEGDAVLHVQRALLSDGMTLFLLIVYLIGYIFLYNFSFALFAYMDRRKVANDVIFNNLIILVISIPFYWFFPVYVTSWPFMAGQGGGAVVPGMQALAYNYSPQVNEFFVLHDPFDNCFPSLHVAVPFAILLILVRSVPGFRLYKWFLGVMTALIAVAIIYLGVHWITDIFAGMAVAAVSVFLTERYSDGFWGRLDGAYAKAVRWYGGRGSRSESSGK
ncbi:MAG: phosphatase PAP2 family protein [Methanobacteriota archaeon]